MYTASALELASGLDPSLSRAVALEAAGRCGVPFEALNEVRAMPSRDDLTAIDWLLIAVDVSARYREAA